MSDPALGPKPRRKNTKSDLGFNRQSTISFPKENSYVGDDSTIAGTNVNDETSDTVKVKRKSRAAPSGRVISAIMLWVKNINKMRTIQMTKAFYLWKYYRPVSGTKLIAVEGSAAETGTVVEANEERVSAYSEQKSSFLELFAENERLREQVAEIKRSSASYEKQLRISAMRATLSTVIRKKLMMKIRYYFDTWQNNSRMEKLVIDTSQRALELEVGLQQVESERDYVRKTQTENAKLRMLLSLTIYFFKWKSRIASAALVEEREKYEIQRSFIFQELRRMREAVVASNQQEKGVFHEAKLRGTEAMNHLTQLREKLQQINTIPPTGSRHRARTYSGENDSNSGRRHGSSSRRSIARKHSASSMMTNVDDSKAAFSHPMPIEK